jgi:hypothetical protein
MAALVASGNWFVEVGKMVSGASVVVAAGPQELIVMVRMRIKVNNMGVFLDIINLLFCKLDGSFMKKRKKILFHLVRQLKL